jgi:hypothetical protein
MAESVQVLLTLPVTSNAFTSLRPSVIENPDATGSPPRKSLRLDADGDSTARHHKRDSSITRDGPVRIQVVGLPGTRLASASPSASQRHRSVDTTSAQPPAALDLAQTLHPDRPHQGRPEPPTDARGRLHSLQIRRVRRAKRRGALRHPQARGGEVRHYAHPWLIARHGGTQGHARIRRRLCRCVPLVRDSGGQCPDKFRPQKKKPALLSEAFS